MGIHMYYPHMNTFRPRYIDDRSLTFRYSLFGPDDLESNLDYLDSNGDRYPQNLYSIDFSNFDLPRMLSSSLEYIPERTGYGLPFDTFQGMVVCETPTIGTRRLTRSPQIQSLLRRYLQDNLARTNMTVQHIDGHVSILDRDRSSHATMYSEMLPSCTLRLEMIVPTDYHHSLDDRYDDAIFASELWILLHDFATNLDALANAPSRVLGKIAYRESSLAQNLHIGIDRCTDVNRAGLMLLSEMDVLLTIAPEKGSILLGDDCDILALQKTTEDFGDKDLQQIIRRALTLVLDRPDRTLRRIDIDSSTMMQQELARLINGSTTQSGSLRRQ